MITTRHTPWTDAERRAWALPEKITVSEWARKYRELSTKETNEPGAYDPDRTPYMKAIADACGDPAIDQVVFIKPTQIGGSEAIRNAFAYWIDQDPGPVLFVLPDEKSAKKIFADRVLPMLRRTDALRRYMTTSKRDVTKYHAELANALVRIAWAGSAQSLASDPYRYVLFDETDKYPPFSGDDADPISLGERRTTTFQDRRCIVKISTPTTRQGNICKEWDASPVQLKYYVPCPRCERFQVLDWSRIKWDKRDGEDRKARADRIEQEQSAWYQCKYCDGVIEDMHKVTMNARGVWAGVKDEIHAERGNVIISDLKGSRRVAFQVSALYSPWLTFSDVAAEGLRAMGNAVKQMAFRNNFLAEPYEQEVSSVRTSLFSDKIKAGYPARICPAWSGLLIATADTQKDHFYFTIRAWGRGPRSRLIDYGRVESFDDLKRVTLESVFPIATAAGGVDATVQLGVRLLLIDAGGGKAPEDAVERSRTHQVYNFAATDPRILALHGHGGTRPMPVPLQNRRHAYTPIGESRSIEVNYLRIDTQMYKDVLAAHIKLAPEDPEAWEVCAAVQNDYLLQMASEHKILDRKGSEQNFVWVKITAGAANHLWDCEVYQMAGADYLHVATVPAAHELVADRKRTAKIRAEAAAGIVDPHGRPFLVTDR